MKSFLILFLSSLVFAKPVPPEILKKFQTSWDETKKYSAAFKQTVTSKTLGSKEESEGSLDVVKPGKLRWNSNSDMSSQILNGKKFMSLRLNARKKTRSVEIYKDVSAMVDMKALDFLADGVQFAKVYKLELLSQTPEIIKLKLTPKEKRPEFYIAEIDKKSYVLSSLTTETPDSTVKMVFTGIQVNPQIDEKIFEYEPNPTDVVTQH